MAIQSKQSHLTDKQIAYFKDRLLELRREAADELEHEHEEVEVEREQRYDDVPIVSTDTVERMSAHELGLINAIDTALERIDQGTYGICVKTGKPISVKRLEAVPYADMTVDAEREEETSTPSI